MNSINTNPYFFSEAIPCANVTCLNFATCDDSSGRFRCLCLSGFEGELCESSKFYSMKGYTLVLIINSFLHLIAYVYF